VPAKIKQEIEDHEPVRYGCIDRASPWNNLFAKRVVERMSPPDHLEGTLRIDCVSPRTNARPREEHQDQYQEQRHRNKARTQREDLTRS